MPREKEKCTRKSSQKIQKVLQIDSLCCIVKKILDEVMLMDVAIMKKLNKQAFIFAALHSIIFLNLAAELLLLK